MKSNPNSEKCKECYERLKKYPATLLPCEATGHCKNERNSMSELDNYSTILDRENVELYRRQDAIGVLEEQLDYLDMLNKDENPTAESKWYGVNWARNTIADMPSAEHHKLNIAEYIHDQYPDVWRHAEKELEVPSAERKGKWIPSDVPESTLCKCDQCGFDCGAYAFNFCPNCGSFNGERWGRK